MPQLTDFLPTTRKEMELRGWDEVDVVLFSGDAYVDHPSFGTAVIGRILEAEGLRVAIVPQPNWKDDLRDFRKMGRPRLFFGVSAGCMDSMVNKYTANKRLRSEDAYTPDGRHDQRPEYPSIIYTQTLKRLYPDVPVVLGGIEASMRRLTHYDYWQDKVRRSILCDSGADILVYGMGEKPIVAIARQLQQVKSGKIKMGSFHPEGHSFQLSTFNSKTFPRPPSSTPTRRLFLEASLPTILCLISTRSAYATNVPRLPTSATSKKSQIRCTPHASSKR